MEHAAVCFLSSCPSSCREGWTLFQTLRQRPCLQPGPRGGQHTGWPAEHHWASASRSCLGSTVQHSSDLKIHHSPRFQGRLRKGQVAHLAAGTHWHCLFLNFQEPTLAMAAFLPTPAPAFFDVRPEVTGVWSLISWGGGQDEQCWTPGQGTGEPA